MFKAIDLKSVPNAKNGRKSETRADLESFIKSGKDAAEIKADGEEMRKKYSSYRSMAIRNRLPVKVILRQDKIYLIRVRDGNNDT